MKKTKLKKESIFVPQDYAEFVRCLEKLNDAARERAKLMLEEEEEAALVKIRFAKKRELYESVIEKISEGIYVYSNTFRRELTDNLKFKTVETEAGTVLWRDNPPSVEVDDEEAAIAELKKRKLLQFIRIKEEVDKEAILKDKEVLSSCKNLRVKQGEEVFVIKPAGVKIEMERGKRKFKFKAIKDGG